jgi:Domain of unknown function (DUF4160)
MSFEKKAYLHREDPESFSTIDEHAQWLEAIFHNPCSIIEHDGELLLLELKHLVKRLDGLRIEIYPNEHPPPHFHVKSPNISASFSIANCEKLKGEISNGDINKVRYWHKFAKPILIEAWNSSRPTNCVVGLFTEE